MSIVSKLEEIQPKYILNCIGITKRKINDNILDVLEVNSVFPHKLARWSKNFNIKIIHFSTDCVLMTKVIIMTLIFLMQKIYMVNQKD